MSNNTDPTIAIILKAKGCIACQQKQVDGWLEENSRHWCKKRKKTLETPLSLEIAARCSDFVLVYDKDLRAAFLAWAEEQGAPGLPFGDEPEA